jgi:hypothetical protein
MNLGRLKTELQSVLQEPTVESSFTDWLNDAVLELAGQYEIPALRLHTPAFLPTTTSDWQYSVRDAQHDNPEFIYMKRVVRVASAARPQGIPIEPSLMSFDDFDPEHSQSGSQVQRVAVEGETLAIFPKADDSLSLWFYRRPLDMADDEDEPEIPDEAFHYRVLVPMVVLRALRLYPEDRPQSVMGDNTKLLQLWQARLTDSLYGNGSLIGWLQKLQGQRGIHLRGPRWGQNVSGGGFWARRAW